MQVLIFGGTGFVGKSLTKELLAHGYQVNIVSRNRKKTIEAFGNTVQVTEWDNRSPLPVGEALKSIDVIINLTGESIGERRWTEEVKKEILDSRLRTTGAIVQAIDAGTLMPSLLLNASAVGYYGPRRDEEITESEPAGQDFLAKVCIAWEKEAYKAQRETVRVVTTRNGVILGNGSALARMILPFKFFAGGTLGSGKQWFSWIHIEDVVRIIRYIIEHPEIKGPVNTVAPEPVTYKDLAREIGRALHRPSWFPVPGFLLKLVLGEMADSIVNGQRVIPQKLLSAGFTYNFPTLASALQNLLTPTKKKE